MSPLLGELPDDAHTLAVTLAQSASPDYNEIEERTPVPVYRHTQIGYVILVGLLVPCPFIVWAFHDIIGLFLLPAVLIACAALFATLTIEIRDGRLKWSFGPGLIRKSVALHQIDHVELWRMRGFLGGWGIHWLPGRGWLYNVSGLRGVAVTLKTGKHFILGTDEPEQLLSGIESAIAKDKGLQPLVFS